MTKRKPGDWWDRSWSVVSGCSWPEGGRPPACDNCWAEALAKRFPVAHGGQGDPTMFCEVLIHPARLDLPRRTRKPTVWAVSLLGDLFHQKVPADFVVDVLDEISPPDRHHYVILTKRPARAVGVMREWVQSRDEETRALFTKRAILLASVWDQASTDEACSAFSRLPAGVLWGLHMEPLLGPVDLHAVPSRLVDHPSKRIREWPVPSWIVVGGETGPGARPMHPGWVRDIRDQCKMMDVKFWLKSWGEWVAYDIGSEKVLRMLDQWRHKSLEMGGRIFLREGKKRAGRSLDGEEHNGVPW